MLSSLLRFRRGHLHHADDAGPPLGTPYTRSVAWPCLYLVIIWQAGWQRRRNIPSALCHLGLLGVVRDGHAQFLAYRRLGSPLLLVPVGEPHSAHLLFPFARCGPCIGRGKAASQGLRSSSSIPVRPPWAPRTLHRQRSTLLTTLPLLASSLRLRLLLACLHSWPTLAAERMGAAMRSQSSCTVELQCAHTASTH